jgi:TP901 family phage tail tape measure protein
MPARNTIEVVIQGDDKASGVMDSVLGKVQHFGASVTRVGAGLTAATAPLTIAMGAAVTSAVQFDEAMTDVGAVLGKNRAEMAALNAQVLKIGAGSRAGPQRAAEAFYDIVGGVADASTHMSILQASIKTAEAGSADLGATTNALIAIMNSYQFEAEEAAYASDVLSRTVGMGVGTMEDFASAMPQVTGLANSLNISFGDLGGMMGYLTTQGNSASQSATQLSAMMAAMLNPNESMKKAIQELGYSSGQAAIDQLGLVGALNAVAETQIAQQDGLAKTLGSMEALRGVTALSSAAFTDFTSTFTEGIEGATAAAQAIQLESPAAKFDLLRSKVGALGTTIGTVVLPVLGELFDQVTPIVEAALAWIDANPQVAGTLLLVVGALIAAGPILMAAGAAITAIGTALGIVLAPAVLLAGAIAAILAAAQLGYPGGMVQLFNDAATSAQQLAFLGLYLLNAAAQLVRGTIETVTGRIGDFLAQNPAVLDALQKGALALGILAAAYTLVQTRVVLVNTVTAALAVTKAALAAGAWAASAGVSGLAAAMMAAVGPILLVVGAVVAAVAAVNNFKDVTKEGLQTAQAAVAARGASLSDEELWQQVKASTVAEYGADNPIVDGIARSLFEQLKGSKSTIASRPTVRDSGGRGVPGSAYLIGRGAQPEGFIPDSPGTFIPNIDRVLAGAGGGGGDIHLNGDIHINANTYDGGRAAMNGALDAVKERKQARGGL